MSDKPNLLTPQSDILGCRYPILQAGMVRNGVTRDEMEGLIDAVQRKLASRQTETRQTGRQVSGAIAIGE